MQVENNLNQINCYQNVVMRTQSMANGLNLYLGSESIYIVGFMFPTMGNILLGEPIVHSFS